MTFFIKNGIDSIFIGRRRNIRESNVAVYYYYFLISVQNLQRRVRCDACVPALSLTGFFFLKRIISFFLFYATGIVMQRTMKKIRWPTLSEPVDVCVHPCSGEKNENETKIQTKSKKKQKKIESKQKKERGFLFSLSLSLSVGITFFFVINS